MARSKQRRWVEWCLGAACVALIAYLGTYVVVTRVLSPSVPTVSGEGIYLGFNGKKPGTSMDLKRVRMDFSYDSEFGAYTPEAYERLLLESMAGEPTLFIRRDEVETAWEIVDSIRDAENQSLLKVGSVITEKSLLSWATNYSDLSTIKIACGNESKIRA